MNKLEWLVLDGTQVSDLTPLAGLTKMQWLYVQDTQVTDLTPLAGMTRMEFLLLKGTKVSTVEKTKDGYACIKWKKVEASRDWATLSAGCYLLRTNVMDWSDEDLWKAYIQLTEAEAAFRIHKSDLKIRPIWHQKEDRVLAHIFVCFLAYVLWKTLGQMCEQAGIGNEPRRVLEELGELRMMDVILPTRRGIEIRKRCLSTPNDHQQILLDRLKLRLPKINQTEM